VFPSRRQSIDFVLERLLHLWAEALQDVLFELHQGRGLERQGWA
jgi:hypothetical protein